MAFKILARGKDYIVVHKPSGFVVYADSAQDAAISAQLVLEKQFHRKLFPVHRIDKDTCGLLAFALSGPKAQELTSLFRTRVVRKQYLAIVHGVPPKKGVINTPLEKHKQKVMEAALTNYATLAETSLEIGGEVRKYALLRLEPETGRFHQIRRHLRSIEHPIVGDPQYGNSWNNERFLEKFGLKRTLLSAVLLHFPDRLEQKMIRVETKPDPDFQKIAKALGL